MDLYGFDGVIFDMDGVIFDSEQVSLKCWNTVLEAYGVTWEELWEIKLQITGTTAANAKRVFCEHFAHIPGFDYVALRARYEACYSDYLSAGSVPLKPGARRLLEWLKENGKKVGLATSTYTEKVMRMLRLAGIEPLFDSIICGDLVTRSKPDPEIYNISLERLRLLPERTFGVEDSYNGIRSLCAAGIHSVMIPDILPVTDEMRIKAEAIFPSLDAFQDALAGAEEQENQNHI